MDWMDWVFGIACAVAGAGVMGAYHDARYEMLPRAKYTWDCPHCPMRIGVSDHDALVHVKQDHLAKYHSEVPQ